LEFSTTYFMHFSLVSTSH